MTGKANHETDQKLQAGGFKYDEANKAYYEVTQQGVNKIYAEKDGDRVCKPNSNNWEKA